MSEQKDLIERLRNWRSSQYDYENDEYRQIPLALEAVACIEALEAELATLRAKLAERDALLRECQSLFGDIVMGEGVDGDEAARMHKQIDALTGGDNAEG